MRRFEGKSAIVTGAGQGIGRAIALLLAKEGAVVAVFTRHQETANRTAEEIKSQGGRALALKVDVTNSKEVTSAVQRVSREYSKIDILVNNVGFGTPKPFIETIESEWDTIITTNLKSTIICSHAVLNYMVERNYGKIVNISSTAALKGTAEQAVYAAAKGGVISFTRALGREVAKYHINVNCVAPGATETPQLALTRSEHPEMVESMKAAIPWGRTGQAEEVAAVVLFLASDEAEWMVGQTLCASGGSFML